MGAEGAAPPAPASIPEAPMSKKNKRPHEPQAKGGDAEAAGGPPKGAGQGAAPAGPSIVDVATALDAELRRFEELAAAVRRAPLSTEKNIDRAAGLIRQAADCQDRFTTQLSALVGAMASTRDRVEAAARAINARAEEVRQRSAEHDALLKRLAALGQEAKEIGALAQAIAARKAREGGADPGAAPGSGDEALEEVRGMLARMTAVARQADELAKEASAAGIEDLARQADSLRQTLGSAHHKVTLLERNLVANRPPRA
jgi:DNA repair exonuclease SbcCD ATPase subunit